MPMKTDIECPKRTGDKITILQAVELVENMILAIERDSRDEARLALDRWDKLQANETLNLYYTRLAYIPNPESKSIPPEMMQWPDASDADKATAMRVKNVVCSVVAVHAWVKTRKPKPDADTMRRRIDALREALGVKAAAQTFTPESTATKVLVWCAKFIELADKVEKKPTHFFTRTSDYWMSNASDLDNAWEKQLREGFGYVIPKLVDAAKAWRIEHEPLEKYLAHFKTSPPGQWQCVQLIEATATVTCIKMEAETRAKSLSAPSVAVQALAKNNQRKHRQHQPKTKLTAKQLAAVEAFGKCDLNYSRTARRLGLSIPSARERIEAAYKKLGQQVPTKSKTQALPTDHRGQATISADYGRQ